jgi:hypothetical protein
MEVPAPRLLEPWIVIGVLAVPAIFFWFLLRPGYSRHARVGGFLLFTMTAVAGLVAGPPQ